MKKPIYEIKDIQSLKDIRFEKARLLIEMSFLEEQIQQQSHYYLHGGLLESMGLGTDLVNKIFHWALSLKIFKKMSHWFESFFHKKNPA